MLREFIWKWVPWCYNRVTLSLTLSKRIVLAAYREATLSNEWLFLHSVDIPIASSTFSAVPLHQIRWRATVNPPVFIGPYTTTPELKHISYLAFSVILPGQDPIELTDWINDVSWSGNIQPSPAELFSLWCCETGSAYFHLIQSAKMEIVTDSGETIIKDLYHCAF